MRRGLSGSRRRGASVCCSPRGATLGGSIAPLPQPVARATKPASK
jgi:hypothetical protein